MSSQQLIIYHIRKALSIHNMKFYVFDGRLVCCKLKSYSLMLFY